MHDQTEVLLQAVAQREGLELVVPPAQLCTDNGVMVAWAGAECLPLGLWQRLPPNLAADEWIDVRPRWPLTDRCHYAHVLYLNAANLRPELLPVRPRPLRGVYIGLAVGEPLQCYGIKARWWSGGMREAMQSRAARARRPSSPASPT